MSTVVKLFQSTDASAPVLTGNGAGTLIGVLDACLVNGYGGGTLTSITREGSTATATLASHGFATGDVVLHAGANETEYNGEFPIVVTGTDTYTFTVTGTPATPATGTMTFLLPSSSQAYRWSPSHRGEPRISRRHRSGRSLTG